MLDLGPYSAFIWPAYAVSALALGAMAVWVVLCWRTARRRLDALEAGWEKQP